MSAPLVVFAVGNPSRGDDAIGPVICGRLAIWLENEKLTERVELIEDFQLNVEHALDLQGGNSRCSSTPAKIPRRLSFSSEFSR